MGKNTNVPWYSVELYPKLATQSTRSGQKLQVLRSLHFCTHCSTMHLILEYLESILFSILFILLVCCTIAIVASAFTHHYKIVAGRFTNYFSDCYRENYKSSICVKKVQAWFDLELLYTICRVNLNLKMDQKQFCLFLKQ